jgi:hypothetical protein
MPLEGMIARRGKKVLHQNLGLDAFAKPNVWYPWGRIVSLLSEVPSVA